MTFQDIGITLARQYVGDVAIPMFDRTQRRDMGDRKCAFEGCNALEFRTTGYCLRHKGGMPDVNVIGARERDSRKSDYDFIQVPLILLGIIGLVELIWIIWMFSTGQWIPCIGFGQTNC